MSKENNELFDFSDSNIKHIRDKFAELKLEGDLINREYRLPKKEKELLIEKLLFNLINEALKNKEKENSSKYTEEEKKRFRKKIVRILKD